MTIPIIETTLAHKDGPVSAKIEVFEDGGAAKLRLSAKRTAEGHTLEKEKTFDLDGTLPADIDLRDDVLILKLTRPETFIGGVFGIGNGLSATPREVRIELRPDTGPESFGLETPRFALFVCHDVEGTVDETFEQASGAEIDINGSVKADVCLGFAAIFPPGSDAADARGAENYALRIDAVSVGLSTGWMLLPTIDLPNLPTLPTFPDLPDVDLPDWPDIDFPDLPGFRIDPLLRWIADLIGGLNVELPDFNWDIRVPALPTLPLGLSVDEAWVEVSARNGETRVQACVKGLGLTWAKDEEITDLDDPTFRWSDFRLCLLYENGTYSVDARLYKAQYPENLAQTNPWGFALPFNLLGAHADCWYFHIGLHYDGTRLCFEALLEVGGLKVTSRLASGDDNEDGNFYTTDLRLLLRDLTVVSNPTSNNRLRLFSNVDIDPKPQVFENYNGEPVPAFSFAENLRAETDDTPDRKRFEFLDGAFRQGERIFVAWEQEDGALMEFLARKLLGRPASTEAEADRTRAALELAWFPGVGGEDDLQIRLDWADVATLNDLDNPAATANDDAPAQDGAAVMADTGAAAEANDAAEICFAPTDLTNGIKLPKANTFDDLAKVTTGEDALALDLPGVKLSLAPPTTQTLLYGRDTEGRDSLSYLLQWQGTDRPDAKKNKALASMRLGFNTVDEGGTRHVQSAADQESNETADLLELHLGMIPQADKPEALQVVGWTEGQGPAFFQVYDQDAVRLPRIVPKRPKLKKGDPGCPPPSPPPVKAVQLSNAAFTGLSLRADDNQPWRLALRSSLTKYLLNMFGGDNNRRISVGISEVCLAEDGESLSIRAFVGIALSSDPGSVEISGTMGFQLDLHSLALTIEDGAELALNQPISDAPPSWVSKLSPVGGTDSYSYTKPLDILGLQLIAMGKPDLVITEPDENDENQNTLPLLTATFDNGSFALLVDDRVDLMVHFDGLGEDGLTFLVEEFFFGPGGLDLTAGFLPTTLKLPGLRKPFSLEEASIVVRDDKIERVEIKGKGVLPELLNEAPVEIEAALDIDPETGRLALDCFACELGDKDAPIFSTGTQCEFTLSKISIGYDDKDGTAPKAWHFLISGYMQFLPEGFDFAGELLEDFSSIRMEFADAPLSDEFFEHIELIATLTEPRRFKVFNLFEMEVRGIGFHPSFGPFGNSPAIIIAGQCEFADLGDVLSVEVDFHRLYIGRPKRGELLPQVHFKGLRVEIASSGFKIAGRVEVPDNGLVKGFKGEGTLLVPGMPEISAAFGFTKLRASEEDRFKRGWFVAVELSRISFQMGPLPLYLRQIGLGFGYRYTSVIIKKFESEDELGPLIKLMQEEIDKHQALARIDTWAEDPERDDSGERARWSIGLEAVFSMTSANSGPFTYEKATEKQFKTVVAQMLVFIRSDFTFLAAAKVWLPISADDFFENVDDMRAHPLASGFMIYSAPKSRLLIHAAKGKNPYLGPPNDPVPESVKKILDNSHFEATFLSEPGLVHAELGWPDRLFFGFEIGLLKLECRGGLLFRAEKDMLVQGIYFSARGEVSLDGDVSLGMVGVGISAHISVNLAMRLMIGISLSKPAQSSIYAAVGIDVSVKFEVRAWLRIKLSFCTITLRLRFSFEIQIVVALEMGWAGLGDLGFRARATVVIGVFGKQLKVKVNVGIREGAVRRAHRKLAPYMRSYLEPGAIPPIPGITHERAIDPLESLNRARAEDRVELKETLAAQKKRRSADPSDVSSRKTGGRAGSAVSMTAFSAAMTGTSAPMIEADGAATNSEAFSLALVRGNAAATGPKKLWFGWVIPTPGSPRLYPVPESGKRARFATLRVPHQAGVSIYEPCITSDKEGTTNASSNNLTWRKARKIDTEDQRLDEIQLYIASDTDLTMSAEEGGSEKLSLHQFLAGCYVPQSHENFGSANAPYPTNWPDGGYFPLADVEDDEPDVITDDRPLSDVSSSPRRALDPDNLYDANLIRMRDAAANELAGGDAFAPNFDLDDNDRIELLRSQLEDQAEGNLSFLMRGFMDDLKSIARDVKLTNDEPSSWIIPDMGRPMITDLGLFVCVVAEDCPDWLCVYDERTTQIRWSNSHPTHGEGAFDGHVRPVVDFRQSDFGQNAPKMANIATNLDDETLNVGWDLDWGKLGRPNGPRDYDPEDFIEKYVVTVTQGNRDEPLGTFDVAPGDAYVKPDYGSAQGATRLKVRYQFNKRVDELGIGGDAAARSRRTRVSVKITLIAQDGTSDTKKPISVDYRPSARPLPPDNAAIELRRRPDGTLDGTLGWRELAPPNAPDVTTTLRWDLVLRPLPAMPLGAWPAEASADSDSGLMGSDALSPRDGDLVVALPLQDPSDQPESDMPFGGDPTGEDGERDPALAHYRIALDGSTPQGIRIFDHKGREIPETDARRGLVGGFFNRTPSLHTDGRAWQVFLRAAGETMPGVGEDRLAQDSVSGLVRLRMALRGVQDPTTNQTALRPLEHLEWTVPDIAGTDPNGSDQVPSNQIWSTPGPIHRAAFVPVHNPVEPHEDPEIEFQLGQDNARGVRISWSAAGTGDALARTAAWTLYESRADDLVNFDRAPARQDEFSPIWSQVRSIFPAEPALAQRATTSFVEPEIWEATPPYHALVAKLRSAALADVTVDPAGWSWDDSVLSWPDRLSALVNTLEKREAETSDGFAFSDMYISEDDIEDDAHRRRALAARLDVGRFLATPGMHPWLALVLGTLALHGAPPALSGTTDITLFEVEVSPGKPVPPPEGTDPDPVGWMENDIAAADPLGWGALSHLGLATTIALRDPVSRLYLTQKDLRENLSEAIGETNTLLNRHDPELPDFNDHLAFDLPLQTHRALRTDAAKVALTDDLSLSMVQVALRPIRSDRVAWSGDGTSDADSPNEGPGAIRYAVATFSEQAVEDTEVTFEQDISVRYPDREMAQTRIAANESIKMTALTRPGETILLRWIDRSGEDSPIEKLPDDVAFNTALATKPWPLLDQEETNFAPLAHTPFGQFKLTREERNAYFFLDPELDPDSGKTQPSKDLKRLIDYLVDAFVVVPPINEDTVSEEQTLPDVQQKALKAARATLEAAILSDRGRLLDALMIWGARFFDAAPLAGTLSGERPYFDASRLTAAIPRRAEPARMSPDAEGRIAFVHPIAEDWATLRSYSVQLSHRYDDLHAPHAAPKLPTYGADHGRTDSALPRRRPVVQPATLGRDLVLSDKNTPFHAVTISEPSDLSLSRLNIALARKLEFHDIQRRYDIAFRHGDWLTQLQGAHDGIDPDFHDNQPEHGADWHTFAPDSFDTEDQTALARTPMARFGGVQFLTPAEPHYYQQRLEVRVRAGTQVSPPTLMRLPAPAPAAPVPHTSDVPVRAQLAISWGDLPDEDVATQEQTFLSGMADAQKTRLTPHLAPTGTALQMRLPRLFESLPEDSRTAWHAVEFSAPSFGHLPDPTARLEVFTNTDNIRATVAIVERGQDDDDPFVSRLVSPQHSLGMLEAKPEDHWSEGFVAQLPVAEALTDAAVTFDTNVSLGPIPSTIAPQPDFEGRLPKNALPDDGPLTRLTALALRVAINPDTSILQMNKPLIGPRWLTRPHMQMPAEGVTRPNLTPPDLAIGLRLFLDPGRRQAMAALPATKTDALLLIETAPTALLSDVLTEEMDFRPLIESALKDGHRFIHLTGDGSVILEMPEDDPDASDIAMQVEVGHRIILCTTKDKTDATTIHHDAFREQLIAEGTYRGLTFAAATGATTHAASLARLAWRAEAADFKVAAHRGNLEPSEWDNRPDAPGDGP